MAKSFTKLKDPKLQLTDTLRFGKLNGCRVCDVIQDHYEYLIWCEKQGFVKFSKEVELLIAETASFKAWEPPDEDKPEEVWYDPEFGFYSASIIDDDVPF